MAGSNDSNAILAILKEQYVGQPIQKSMLKNWPLLASLSKKTDFAGKYRPLPIVSNGTNTSNQFVAAKNYQVPVTARQFDLTTGDRFGFATMDGKAIAQSRNNSGAFQQLVETAMNAGLQEMTNALAVDIYRSGTGTIATTSDTTTGVLTLTNKDDVVNFRYGMALQASASDGGALLTGTAPIGYVISRDPSAGTVTVSKTYGGAAATPDGWGTGATANYLVKAGDGSGNGTPVLYGLQAWCPSSVTSTPFFGVDRTIDRISYAGLYLDYSSKGIDEAFIAAGNQGFLYGAMYDRAYCSVSAFQSLVTKLGATRVRVSAGDGDLGFDGAEVLTAGGKITVLPDPACPVGRAFFMEQSHVALYSMGEAPRILDDDGMEMLRVSDQNAVEARLGYYAQIGVDKPLALAQVVLPS